MSEPYNQCDFSNEAGLKVRVSTVSIHMVDSLRWRAFTERGVDVVERSVGWSKIELAKSMYRRL